MQNLFQLFFRICSFGIGCWIQWADWVYSCFIFISVTLKISVSNHENLHFSSKVRLKADSSGLVDLTKSVPSCGAYQVPDLMALYWKMDYQKGSDKRLLKFHEVTFNHLLVINSWHRITKPRILFFHEIFSVEQLKKKINFLLV